MRTAPLPACQICGNELNEWSVAKVHRHCYRSLPPAEKRRLASLFRPRHGNRVFQEQYSEADLLEKERRIVIYRRQLRATGRINFSDPDLHASRTPLLLVGE